MPDANDTVPRWARRRAEATIRQGRHFVSAGALLLTCPALTGVFVRASLSNQGGQPALLAHPQALVLEEDNVAEGRTESPPAVMSSWASRPLASSMASWLSKIFTSIRTG